MDYQDFQRIRKEYEDQGIDVHDLDDSPFKQTKIWMNEANDHSPGPWFETNAMALATGDKNGSVSVRIVLLKGIDDNGIRFFTNYDSQKGQQLAVNPNCSGVIHWPYMGRQIRFTGKVSKTSREISQEYFHSRPRNAQIGAAISNQSGHLKDRYELEKRMADFAQEIGDADVPLPENWGGYQLEPQQFEFWQGRSSRLHDRIVYEMSGTQWVKNRLAP